MPRLIITLIVLGFVIGAWSNLRPANPTDSSIKGQTATRDPAGLPSLTPIPTKKDNAKDPLIDARNVAVIDVSSGYLLLGKNAFEAVPIASLTKLMTALIIVEENNLQDVVEITQEAAFANGSTILLRPGEKITVENLLKGLLIQSGNDAAYALAKYNAGSIDQFVTKMNDKAKFKGFNTTTLKDPAGLNDEGVASPKDIAILMAHVLRQPKITEIIRIPETIISSTDGLVTHKLENSNRLVKDELFFPGIIGGKTGFTPTAGHNLVAAAERDGHTIVAVIINTFSQTKEASAIEARKALDWAFTNHVWLITE